MSDVDVDVDVDVEEEICPYCHKEKGVMSCEFPSHFRTFNEDGYYCENCYVITITSNSNGYSDIRETCLKCLQLLIAQGGQEHYVCIQDIHKTILQVRLQDFVASDIKCS